MPLPPHPLGGALASAMAVAVAGWAGAGEALAGTLRASPARAAGQNLRTGPDRPARMPHPTLGGWTHRGREVLVRFLCRQEEGPGQPQVEGGGPCPRPAKCLTPPTSPASPPQTQQSAHSSSPGHVQPCPSQAQPPRNAWPYPVHLELGAPLLARHIWSHPAHLDRPGRSPPV